MYNNVLKLEVGLGHEHLHTRPAEVLLPNWVCSKPAAPDFTVVLTLGSTHILLKRTPQHGQLPSQQKEGSMPTMTRSALSSNGYVSQWLWRYMELGVRKHSIHFLDWPPDVLLKSSVPRPEALSSIYVRLNMTLVRANARAVLSRVTLG